MYCLDPDGRPGSAIQHKDLNPVVVFFRRAPFSEDIECHGFHRQFGLAAARVGQEQPFDLGA